MCSVTEMPKQQKTIKLFELTQYPFKIYFHSVIAIINKFKMLILYHITSYITDNIFTQFPLILFLKNISVKSVSHNI